MANTWYLDYANGADFGTGIGFSGSALNPSDKAAGITLTNNNLTATNTASGAVRANSAVQTNGGAINTTKKYYWEVTINTQTSATFGIGMSASSGNEATSVVSGSTTFSLAYRPGGTIVASNATQATIATYAAGSVIGIAYDGLNNKIYFRVNGGNWNNNASNDPVAVVGGIGVALAAAIPVYYSSASGDSVTFNFGATAYTQTPPVGFGNFTPAWQTMAAATAAKGVLAGDTVRIAKSPDPTSLAQNATWTNASQSLLTATKILSAATNASPIACTTTLAHGWTTGDYVSITGAVGNTAANGQWQITVTSSTTFTLNGSTGSGTWTSGGTVKWWTNHAVTLTTPVTATIDRCDAAWTAVNGVTVTVAAIAKEGTGSVNFVHAASNVANTLYAYKALGSAVDFSAYQQISFWFRYTGSMASNNFRICLCSDAAGAVIVNSAPIPIQPNQSFWMSCTVDFGTALGSSIQSVAIYSGSVPISFANTLNIDNIIACKASSSPDSLTLSSLIGKNSGTDGWFGIQSINGTTVMLDNDVQTVANAGRGYSGVSETVNLWKREATKTSATVTTVHSVQVGGTAVSGNSVFDGGYNTTTGLQDGDTYWDGQVGNVAGISSSNLNYITFNRINMCRYALALSVGAGGGTGIVGLNINAFNFSNNTGQSIFFSGIVNSCTVNVTNINNCASVGLTLPGTASSNSVTIVNANSTTATTGNIIFGGIGNKLFLTNCKNSAGYGVVHNGVSGFSSVASNINFANNFTASISANGSPAGTNLTIYKNCVFGDTTEAGAFVSYTNERIAFQNYNNTAGVHKTWTDGGNFTTDAGIVHTSGTAWKMSPTSITARTAIYPLDLTIAKVFVNANSLVTVTAWFRRDNATINGLLAVRGGQLNGVASDVTSAMTASPATWQQLTVTFTPTEAGVIDVQAWAYDGTSATTSVWVDDFAVSQ